VDFECGETDRVKAQALRAVRQREAHVRADPIEHRHEIIDDQMDALGGQIAETGGVVREEVFYVAASGFDGFVDWEGLGGAPFEAGGLDQLPAFADGFAGPDFAIRDLVEGGEEAGRAGLADVCEGDGVSGAKPAEALLQKKEARVGEVHRWSRVPAMPQRQGCLRLVLQDAFDARDFFFRESGG
jgi:hypothetical protein